MVPSSEDWILVRPSDVFIFNFECWRVRRRVRVVQTIFAEYIVCHISTDYSNCPMAGTIPSEIGLLTTLTNLDLGKQICCKSRHIPFVHSHKRFASKSFLVLSITEETNLIGQIPKEIGNLVQLNNLALGKKICWQFRYCTHASTLTMFHAISYCCQWQTRTV